MKRTISLWLGLLAFALVPVLAQTPTAPSKPMGKIHGHITGPEGAPRTSGAVSLSTDGGQTNKFTFPVSSIGDYDGDGKADLLWYNSSTLGTQIWPALIKTSVIYPGNYPTGFTIQK